MKKLVLFILIAALFSGSLIFSQDVDYKGFSEWAKKVQGSTEYYIYTPKNLQVGQKYPIALFMHGCCGSDNTARLRNCIDPPVRMWHNFGENYQTIPTYIISPATSSGWSQHFTNLKAVIDDIVANKQGDPQRIYVCGFSMGGRGTYDFLSAYPSYFAAAIPMGMNFGGDQNVTKNIPFWANRGETDTYCNTLPADVGSIRALNGRPAASFTYQNATDGYATPTSYSSPTLASAVFETGVNPMFSSFRAVGHGVQWDAASTQDLTGWALSKINDGNYYPNVYLKSPAYKQVFTSKRIAVEASAVDNDGSIAKVELYVNGILKSTLNASPYKDSVDLHTGDNLVEAKAYDDKGKTSIAAIIARVDNIPVLMMSALPDARQGEVYAERLYADGNGPFRYKVSTMFDALPAGMSLQTDGIFKGIPQTTGSYNIGVMVYDDDNDSILVKLPLTVRAMSASELLVTNARTYPWHSIVVSKLRNSELPNTDAGGNEINISNVSIYGGLTAIFPSIMDASSTSSEYMTFDVSEDAIVRIAYEKVDCTLTSTIPTWLQSWTKDNSHEITAQYRYFDVYSKNFSKGQVSLQGANALANKVAYNYFVLVQKQGTTNDTDPEVTNKTSMTAYIGHKFNEYLSVLDGEGSMLWSQVSGSLPGGITLSRDGRLQGYPLAKGTFNFSLKVKDSNGDSLTTSFTITVKDIIYPIYTQIKDTASMVNTGAVTINLKNITNGVSPTQDVTIEVIPDKTTVISLTNPVSAGGNNYTFTYTPKPDQAGVTIVNVRITDNNNPDTELKTTNNYFKVRVMTDKNHAPSCDSIADVTVAKTYAKQTITFTGVTDGDGDVEPQTITASISATNVNNVIISPSISYTKGSKTGTISFYTGAIGTSVVSLKLQDNGGTDMGGVDTKTITFKVNIVGAENDESKGGVSVYPNPFNDKITVAISEGEYQTISIVDAAGKTVLMQQVLSSANEVDLTGAASGTYQVVLEGRNGRYSTSIIKAN